MYVKRVYEYGNLLEVEKFNTWKYQAKNSDRTNRAQKTPLAMQKVNERNAKKTFARIVNANFGCGDYHVVLTYDSYHRTGDKEVAKKDLQKYLRKLRVAAKKKGTELKYVSVTEYGKNGAALHHHLIIKNIGVDPSILAYLWELGHAKFIALDDEGDYTELASYFMKQADKLESSEELTSKKHWTSSKNLIHPTPKETIVTASTWRQEPVVPKGYVLIRESVSTGVSDYTGYPYQYYICRKVQADKVKRHSFRELEERLDFKLNVEGKAANDKQN